MIHVLLFDALIKEVSQGKERNYAILCSSNVDTDAYTFKNLEFKPYLKAHRTIRFNQFKMFDADLKYILSLDDVDDIYKICRLVFFKYRK